MTVFALYNSFPSLPDASKITRTVEGECISIDFATARHKLGWADRRGRSEELASLACLTSNRFRFMTLFLPTQQQCNVSRDHNLAAIPAG